jgi:hypothetical protein
VVSVPRLQENNVEIKVLSADKQEFCVGKRHLFAQDTINSLGELGSILQRIHKRLVRDGYVIENGQAVKKPDNINNDDKTQHS